RGEHFNRDKSLSLEGVPRENLDHKQPFRHGLTSPPWSIEKERHSLKGEVHMKKLWYGGMASGILAAVLAGCGGQDQGTDNGETDTGTEDTENTETVQEDTGYN